jgi:competence ComEA-like helix-hairpin-helix protein
MKFGFLDRFKKDQPPAEEPRGAVPVPATPAAAAAPVDAEGTARAEADTVEDARAKLRAIREVLGKQDEFIQVPFSALLHRLPDDLRGENWREGNMPVGTFDLEKNALLDQLRRGRVTYPLKTFTPLLPPGLVRGDPERPVDLDLPTVVGAIPQDVLQGAARPAKALAEVADMPDYFAPKEATLAEAAPAAAPSDVSTAARVPPGPAAEPGRVETEEAPPPVPAPVTAATVATAAQPPAEPAPVAAPAAEPAPEPVVAEAAVQTAAEAAAAAPAAEAVPVPAPAAEVGAEPAEEPVPAPVLVPAEAEPAAEAVSAPEAAPTLAVAAALAGAETAATAEPAPEAQAPRTLPVDWDGVEHSLDSAVRGLDLNEAGEEDLLTLPGVGPARARAIVAFRRDRGPFRHVYELLCVPGVGPQLFRQMTGLSAASGRNRHEVLNDMLAFEPHAHPTLGAIAEAVARLTGALGCVLTNSDGIPLGRTASVAEQAMSYAALTVQLFKRSSHALAQLAGNRVDCIVMPNSDPALTLYAVNDVYLVVAFAKPAQAQRSSRKLLRLAYELGWFLGRRAVVRAWGDGDDGAGADACL